ncbi:hypothetical protein AAAV04_03590 [Phascolarctobacterium faecium]|jgi:hypothetical protein|uniref:hypothetical protein n=2 Tax=Phascolarctobacterium faecium TaxID=33025 RepID=UPI002047CCFC|nr:hypothetical protein [Phascolarctobacterium faecium]DAN95623.1 MAG TPA: hypothetical protein [Caudoviricetes sp.]
MKKKKVIISITAGLLSMIIATSFASAKFRGGSVIDVARVAKETQKVVEETKILSEITTLRDLQEEFFGFIDDLGQVEKEVLTVVKEANILSNSVNGIIGAENTYQAKVENLYSIDFLSDKYGNTPEAWKANHARLSEAYEKEYKNSVDVAQKSADISSRIELQRDKILNDYSKGVISEKQKELMLKGLLATSKNTNAMLSNQVMVNAITDDMRTKTKEKLTDAQQQYHSFGFISADDQKHKKAIEENKITELPK